MATVQEQIAKAKAAGYSDSEIATYLGSNKEYAPKIKTALDAGYKPEEIISHLTGPAVSKKNVSDSSIIAFGAGAGKGFGQVALNAQKYLGKGLDAVGLDSAGQWLVKDAEQGLQKIQGELAPYAENSPIAAGAGEITGNVVATAPVGGILAKGAKAAGASAPIVNSLASSGMSTGQGGNMLVRVLGGGVTGGVSAGLVDPDAAETGAAIGAALPGVAKAGGMVGSKIASGLHNSSNKLMQSAIKPTIKELQTGDAAIAVRTLLDNGINPNQAGVNKLRQLIGGINDDISGRIANSSATIDKGNVLSALGDVRQKFANQVSPTSDLNAISGVMDDFIAHPAYPGQTLPIQAAQQLKQGTYKALSKKYGQLGSAEVEAQKGLARGLKEEISKAIPEIQGLNAQESKLITTLNVAERRALMELNKNPMGLAALATSPASWAAFMADRSATFKALAARMLNSSVNKAQSVAPRLEGAANPLLRSAPALVAANGE